MTVIEYGKQNTDTVILLHGGGLFWWNYREASKLLTENYHVVLPVLDGHADSDAPFVSIEENAARLDVGLLLVAESIGDNGFYLKFKKEIDMDEKLLGKCGFFCGCCPTYIKGGCKGCTDEHAAGDCYTRDCVLEQGIACCGACERFPCDTILTKPHTTVLDKEWLQWKKESNTNR